MKKQNKLIKKFSYTFLYLQLYVSMKFMDIYLDIVIDFYALGGICKFYLVCCVLCFFRTPACDDNETITIWGIIPGKNLCDLNFEYAHY